MFGEFYYLARYAERKGKITIALDLDKEYKEYPKELASLKQELAKLDNPDVYTVASIAYNALQMTDSFILHSSLHNMKHHVGEFNAPLLGDKYQYAQLYISIINALDLVNCDIKIDYPEQLYRYALLESVHKFIKLDYKPHLVYNKDEYKEFYYSLTQQYFEVRDDLTMDNISAVKELAARLHDKAEIKSYFPVDEPIASEDLSMFRKLTSLYKVEELKYSGKFDLGKLDEISEIEPLMVNFFEELTEEQQDYVMFKTLKQTNSVRQPSINQVKKYLSKYGLLDESTNKNNTTQIKSSNIFG